MSLSEKLCLCRTNSYNSFHSSDVIHFLFCPCRLQSCGLSGISCAAFISVLRPDTSRLRELDLRDNLLQDSGVKQLSDLMETDGQLFWIDRSVD